MVQIEIKSIPDIPSNETKINTSNITCSVTYSSDLSYDEFFNHYMVKNQPCIIKNVTSDWECSKKWIHANGEINYDYLTKTYGEIDAPIANCSDLSFNSHCKSEMKIKTFMEYMKDRPNNKLLYLKDWHLKKGLPNDNFYVVPHLFASDWLNEHSIDNREDDYIFVYIGPKESWTPLHADVYSSFSWSVNVTGRKKWTLFPPGEEEKLQDSLGNLPVMFDPKKFENIKYFEIIQEKGDAFYVPSGWYHQVVNEVDTISINHNWVNGCNIATMWVALQKSYKSVKHEIEELKETPEFYSQCQIVLKSYFGMDIESFINFIMYMAQKRLNQITSIEGDLHKVFNRFTFGPNHLKFDLINLHKVMESILIHPDVIAKQIGLNENFPILKQKIFDTITQS